MDKLAKVWGENGENSGGGGSGGGDEACDSEEEEEEEEVRREEGGIEKEAIEIEYMYVGEGWSREEGGGRGRGGQELY